MAVNKTAEPWPDERRSDLDHDSCIKLIKPDYFNLDIHVLDPQRKWKIISLSCLERESFVLIATVSLVQLLS